MGHSLKPGDRVALTAKFLKAIGAHSGVMPARRGTFLSIDVSMTRLCGLGEYARVRWDDTDAAALAALAEQYGSDYAEDVEQLGSLVLASNIAKVGSARFACSDL